MKIEMSFSLNMSQTELEILTGKSQRDAEMERLEGSLDTLGRVMEVILKKKASPQPSPVNEEAASAPKQEEPAPVKEEPATNTVLATEITEEHIKQFSNRFGYSVEKIKDFLNGHGITTLEQFMNHTNVNPDWIEYARDNF